MTTAPLILGGTGRVGRALAQCMAPGTQAVWQHRSGATPPAQPAVSWDILNTPAPDLGKISAVVHLARGADAAEEVALATAACDLGKALAVPVLIASTQAVYGPVTGPVTETTPCQPVGDYGQAKHAMEQAVRGRATCLRIGNVAGCDMLLMNAAKGPVTLDRLPDGTSPRRSYISAPVLWQVIAGLLAQPAPLPDVINVAQPGPVAMADLLAAAGLQWQWRSAGAGVLPALDLDVGRLMTLVPLPVADPATLIAQARSAGWAAA